MPDSFIGQTLLNRYHIEEFVALTPLGDLHRVTDVHNNNPLALTILPKVVANDADAIKGLEAVYSKLRGITNQNLISYLGVFQTPTLAFLLEDWVDGPSFLQILERAPVTATEALVYTRAICSALDAVHSRNFLHLNLAPELIRINKQGEIRLGGLANAQPVGQEYTNLKSKYPRLYLAPEQFFEQPLTSAADTYALAVLLYQLVTGVWINGRPAPKTNEAVRRAHLEITPPAPISLNQKIPDNFSRMILWALRKKPDDRLKTTTELLSSLALAAQLPVNKIPPRVDAKAAPVTASILGEWQYLAPAKPNIISQDRAPLHDRLAAVTVPESKKKKSRVGVLPIFIIAVLAGFASLFWFVHPARTPIPTPIQFTPFAADFTPPPTTTPLPKPTDEHGGRIAFTCTRGEYNQVCMVNRDGTGLAQLTDMDASNYYPVFTPDGGSLLFVSNRNGSFDLYLLIFAQKKFLQLTNNVGNVVSPSYSPDGRRIAFANKAGDGPTSIWMVNADGLNPHLVYTGPNTIVGVAWSPNGEKIAYAMSLGVPGEYEIYTMDPSGKNNLRISQGLRGIGGSLSWSPDSKYLLVYAGPYADKDIFRIEVATGKFIQLTHGGNNAGGVYSPDGRYIVFNSLRNNNQADLYIMRADGNNEQQLTNNPEPDWGPAWAP